MDKIDFALPILCQTLRISPPRVSEPLEIQFDEKSEIRSSSAKMTPKVTFYAPEVGNIEFQLRQTQGAIKL
ncbi:hypothetical protein PSQ90_15485 [Devosia rhodophyticola]|uniref:Uncharacterized protein n=1 Tax=Devosia rhodophyticola TaxID=3026423 RepID=A0ABY7YW98_9HYPH|nr:hypothetical protein [Devosia rhodophyticola]WDR05648.1 hypothetical protein PSQ90_15485 [Devosia rhodophyticola]